MKTFLSLVKTLLNVNFSISAFKYKFRTGQKGKWESVAIALSVGIGVLFMEIFYIMFMLGLFFAAKQINQPELVIAIAFIAGQILVLFFGVLLTMSSFYFSSDIKYLIALPLTPYQVIGAKFSVLLVNEYLLLIPILLPPFIIYGVGMESGVFYWVKALILILMSPAVPLLIDALFIVIIMRFINLRRSKDLLAIVGGLFGIVLSIGINFFIQNNAKNFNPQDFMAGLSAGDGLVKLIGSKFPPGIWAVYGLTKTGMIGLGYLFLYIALSVVLLLAFLGIANKVFYRSVIAGDEISRKGKKLDTLIGKGSTFKQSSPIKAIYQREWKLLFRTPVYVLNGLVGAFVGPIILLLMFWTGEGMDELYQLSQNASYALYFSMGGLALMLFTSGINIVPSTAVSREGSSIWISKILPLKPETQVLAKLFHGLAISALPIILIAVALPLIFEINLLRVLAITVIALVGSVTQISLGLLIDVLMPKLDWSNPQQAMKQNTNGLLGMLVSLLFMGVSALLVFVLIMLSSAEWIIYLVLFTFMIILGIISVKALCNVANKKFQSLEV